MAEFRVPIPSEMLDAGFPVEWVVITDEGSVYIHYANPVVMETLTLDDRRIVEDHGPMQVLIGTGQTVELTTRRANGTFDLIARCPNCALPLPEKVGHPWVACPSPGSPDVISGTAGVYACAECFTMANGRIFASKNRQPPAWRPDGYCPCCGQKPVRMRLLDAVKKTIAKIPDSEKNSKTMREIARLTKRLMKETKIDG